jgi:putative tricarboxylic transport membrane protein
VTQPGQAARSPRGPGADLGFGLALSVAGAWIAWVAGGLPAIPAQAYGPGFFPMWVGIGLAACGVGMVWRALAGRVPAAAASPSPQVALPAQDGAAPTLPVAPPPVSALRIRLAIAWMLLGLALVGFLLERVGFLVCMPVFMLGFLGLVGEPWRRSLLTTAASTAIVYFSFAKLLKVPVPAGWLQGFI